LVALLAKGCSLCQQLTAKLLAKLTVAVPFGRAGAIAGNNRSEIQSYICSKIRKEIKIYDNENFLIWYLQAGSDDLKFRKALLINKTARGQINL
jgi:hypothetical protein